MQLNPSDLAIEEARNAALRNEVPVGAVVYSEDPFEIIASAGNRILEFGDMSAHAELISLREAATRIGNERLTGMVLLSTLEPCPMCCGAAILGRLRRIEYLAEDKKMPAAREILKLNGFNHYPEMRYIPDPRAAELLKEFFRSRRPRNDQS